VEQSLEGEAALRAFPSWELAALARRFGTRDEKPALGLVRGVSERQEGNGAGDGDRLHERRKALEGEPHERIRHETRPAGSGRMNASRGCENLQAQAVGFGNPDHFMPLPRAGRRCRGEDLKGGAAVVANARRLRSSGRSVGGVL
jgi:hypothetical protein